MADLRSLTTILEADLKQGKGIVGWGTFAIEILNMTVQTINACQRRHAYQMQTIQRRLSRH
jgi:hypothetical protein